MLIFTAFMALPCMTLLPFLASAEWKLVTLSRLPRNRDFTSFKGKAQESGKMELLWQHAHRPSTSLGRLERPVTSQATEHRSKVISSAEHFSRSNLIYK